MTKNVVMEGLTILLPAPLNHVRRAISFSIVDAAHQRSHYLCKTDMPDAASHSPHLEIPPPAQRDKASLRTVFKRHRRALTASDLSPANDAITRKLLLLPALQNARTIFSYITIQNEVDTCPVINALLDQGVSVIAPPVDQASEIHEAVHFVYRGDPALSGALPPRSVTPDITSALDLSDIDLFIVPGIVWDPRGYRVGFGGGYFDWLLSQARPDAHILGLAYEWQVVDMIPIDPWDRPVHALLTEKRLIHCPHPQG
ncbi:5-formyltetrahydrofolate cyclo-ligase [candidate division BRC1 bacterium HGW-BRC1-1]|nr:MAG: 5-formyltetrahydrofolate cyclo-ligase [candidate division BRC1 bacterium HGW-BRC1-1]